MSIRVGTVGDAEITFTVDDPGGEVTNMRLITRTRPARIQFLDASDLVIFDQIVAPNRNIAVAILQAARPQLISQHIVKSDGSQADILRIPYRFGLV